VLLQLIFAATTHECPKDTDCHKLGRFYLYSGYAGAQLFEALRYNRNVAGSIPDRVTGIFHWLNLTGYTSL